MFDKNGYGIEIDFWSLGILTFHLISGVMPFPSDRISDPLGYQILNNAPNMTKIYSVTDDEDVHMFLKGLLEKNVHLRLGNKNKTSIKKNYLSSFNLLQVVEAMGLRTLIIITFSGNFK